MAIEKAREAKAGGVVEKAKLGGVDEEKGDGEMTTLSKAVSWFPGNLGLLTEMATGKACEHLPFATKFRTALVKAKVRWQLLRPSSGRTPRSEAIGVRGERRQVEVLGAARQTRVGGWVGHVAQQALQGWKHGTVSLACIARTRTVHLSMTEGSN